MNLQALTITYGEERVLKWLELPREPTMPQEAQEANRKANWEVISVYQLPESEGKYNADVTSDLIV